MSTGASIANLAGMLRDLHYQRRLMEHFLNMPGLLRQNVVYYDERGDEVKQPDVLLLQRNPADAVADAFYDVDHFPDHHHDEEDEQDAAPAAPPSLEDRYRVVSLKFVPSTHGDMTCPICYENFSAESRFLMTECGHVFHTACMQSWLSTESKKVCPLCRYNLR